MPYKHTSRAAARFRKPDRVENWREYEVAPRDRGSLTVWVTPEAIAAWHPAKTWSPGAVNSLFGSRDRDRRDAAAGICPATAATEGLLCSVTTLLGLGLDVPVHTTLSRRSAALSLVTALAVPAGPVNVVIDSTGLNRPEARIPPRPPHVWTQSSRKLP